MVVGLWEDSIRLFFLAFEIREASSDPFSGVFLHYEHPYIRKILETGSHIDWICDLSILHSYIVSIYNQDMIDIF